MGLEEIFANALKRSQDKNAGVEIVTGIVKEVNNNTCTVERDNAPTLYKVRLQAIEDEASSFINIKPKTGSVVICGIIEGEQAEAFIIQCSEIEEVNIEIGNKQYKINSAGHLIKGGSDTLKEVLTMIIEAVSQVVVVYGNNPDYIKLQEAMVKINNILL